MEYLLKLNISLFKWRQINGGIQTRMSPDDIARVYSLPMANDVSGSRIWHFHPSHSAASSYWSLTANVERVYRQFENDKELFSFLDSLRNSHRIQVVEGTRIVSISTASGDSEGVESGRELPPGQYTYTNSRVRPNGYLVPTRLRTDTFVEQSQQPTELIRDIEYFLKSESIYRELGFSYRRGYLLFGSPGNGKTSLIRQIISKHLPPSTVAIWLKDAVPDAEMLKALEALANAGRMVVFVTEELASLLAQRAIIDFLEFLDGENSLTRSLFFATTNSIEHLPNNLKNRPSRFDLTLEITNPSSEDRSLLLSRFLGRGPTASEIENSNELSIAHLKEAVLEHRMKGTSLSQALLDRSKKSKAAAENFAKRAAIGVKPTSDLQKLFYE